MIRVLVASFVTCIAGAACVQAADVASEPALPAAYDWSGFNVGVFAGVGSGEATYANFDNDTSYAGDVNGTLYGGRLGLRYQSGAWVLGAAVSGALDNIDGSGTDGVDSASFDVEWTTSADLQLGVAHDRLMLYGLVGLAAASVQHVYDSGTGSNNVSYDSRTHTGYSLGGGVEYAFSDMISGWAEARRYNLNAEDFDQVLNVISHDVDVDFSTVTVGVGLNF